MRQIISILSLTILCAGCTYHRNFARVDLNGTFQIISISGSPHARVIPGGELHIGNEIVIRQTESQLILTRGTDQKILDLRKKNISMRGNAIIYKPYGGARIITGPGTSQQYDRLVMKDDQLMVESKDFESGLAFLFIPYKEGGTTTVHLQKQDRDE